MPCLLAILIAAFPRVAIVLLYLFTNFFAHVYSSLIIPILGFIFLPLTLIVYTYLSNTHAPMNTTSFVIIFIAVILDLGLVGAARRRR
ncbi:MAG TPA: hypothetical protein VN633_25280 [Bryobacteraceae bacterium]|nr:hypothetical protein [Bryobacteraceae bacterium]